MTMLLLENSKNKVFVLAALIAAFAVAVGCDEDGEDPTLEDLVGECLTHSGDADDPCPQGCTQISKSYKVYIDENGVCSREKSSFCAPGEGDVYWSEVDAWAALFRVDADSTSPVPPAIQPEEVRVIVADPEPPGWSYCQPDSPSALCQCGIEQTGEV